MREKVQTKQINTVKLNDGDVIIALILTFFSAFLIFFRINAFELAEWDEGIYANIAGAIVESGDWLNMKLQGLPWYEKEIFPFWLMAFSIKLFGFNEFAVRLPFGLLSILTAPLFFIITRYWINKIWSILTSLLFLLSPYLWLPHMMRTGNFDVITLVFFLCGVASYLYLRHSKYFWISAVCLAFTMMTRGLMGILFLFLIFSTELLRSQYKLDKWNLKQCINYILIVLSPWFFWHVYLLFKGGQEYIHTYWTLQFFTRLTSSLQLIPQPISYYATHAIQILGIKYILDSTF